MTHHTVLIIADEPQVRRTMLSSLTAECYSVIVAKSADDALQRIEDARPDLIILELNPLGRASLDVCRTLRRRSDSPIIVLAAPSTERDKVTALDAGADDYVVRPFGMQELLARMRAILRRATSTKDISTFECSELKIDFSCRVVFVRGSQIRLTPKEFELLAILVVNQGRPLRHRMLLQAIWGPDYGEETEYLRVFISQLRKKIESDPTQPQLIRTEPWLGYRFEPPSLQSCETRNRALFNGPSDQGAQFVRSIGKSKVAFESESHLQEIRPCGISSPQM
jgi:two-component system KDP operon response regulator KdpE